MEKIYVRVCPKRKYICFKRKLVTLPLACMAVECACLFGGCSSLLDTEPEMGERKEEQGTPGTKNSGEKAEGQEHTENQNVRGEERVKSNMEAQEDSNRETIKADWAAYFDGLNGAAVLYDASNMLYSIYNQDLALTQRSHCSTFKIISSLIALEHGLIDPEDSIRPWSGEEFWNEAWNHDISFPEAFRASCVWYFRQVADDIGKERMQEEVRKLGYGNCDISDWEGRLNTNNNKRALTGFWIESSLNISPKEQAEAMERIFRPDR